jgi:hypothetical protein
MIPPRKAGLCLKKYLLLNPKHEIRNPKQGSKSEIQMFKTNSKTRTRLNALAIRTLWTRIFTCKSRSGAYLSHHLSSAGVTQLQQGLGLDLTDALSGNPEFMAQLFEGVRFAVSDSKSFSQDCLFARAEG